MVTTSKKCVERLHRYRNALYRMQYLGFIKVFSDNLADTVGVTASQVRKDFSLLGPLGNKRGGYLVEEVIEKLNQVLGKDKPHNVIIAGAGNIGQALKNYLGFESEGINIVAAFDNSPQKIDLESKVPVYPIEELRTYVRKNKVKIAILAVPDAVAQEVVDTMIEAGIKGILNFVPRYLNLPDDFVINNVHVGLELEKIIYFVNEMDKQD